MLRILSACLLLCLVACATPYQSRGFAGGFSETQLAPNIFHVRFNGNGFTRSERATDLALLRSAEVALAHGFRYFGITTAGEDVLAQSFATPQSSYTTTSPNGLTSNTQFFGGQTFTAFKPSARNVIACFNEDPQGTLFNAEFVAKSIRTKYGMSLAAIPKSRENLYSDVRRFAADPRYSHFDEVRATMADLIESGKADTLEEAYAIAVKRAGLQ